MNKTRRRGSRAKRVVVLLGSPRRKGNSAALAGEIARGAAGAGAEVETFFLQGMRIAACTACQGCQRPGARGCVIDDDMQRIYGPARKADAIVFAGPIYWFTLSAQLKLAVDRFYALIGPKGHAFKGKRMALAFTFGGSDAVDSGCVNAIRAFQDAFAYMGATLAGSVYGQAGEAGEIKANKALLRQARELGRGLAAG